MVQRATSGFLIQTMRTKKRHQRAATRGAMGHSVDGRYRLRAPGTEHTACASKRPHSGWISKQVWRWFG